MSSLPDVATINPQSTQPGVALLTHEQTCSPRRLFWICCLVLGVILTGCQITGCVLLYLGRHLVVQIDTTPDVTVLFPVVTLCNFNVFRSSEAIKLGWYSPLNSIYSQIKLEDTVSDQSNSSIQCSVDNDVTEGYPDEPWNLIGGLDVEHVYHSIVHTPQHSILSCIYGETQCHQMYTTVTPTQHGYCHTIDVNTIRSHGIEDQQKARLRLTLNTESYEFMNAPTDNNGFLMWLHEADDHRFDLGRSFTVGTGSSTFLNIHADMFQRSRSCESDDVIHSNCILECMKRDVMSKCGCHAYWMHGYLSTQSACNISAHVTCVLPMMESMTNAVDPGCDCVQPCEEIQYQPFISQTALKTTRLKEMINGQLTDSDLLHKVHLHHDLIDRQLSVNNGGTCDGLNEFGRRATDLMTKLELIADRMLYAKDVIRSMSLELGPRINFHVKSALQGAKNVVQQHFIAGWEAMDDRTFAHVATEFYDTISALNMTVTRLIMTSTTELTIRKIMYVITERELNSRMELAIRALDNLTQVYYAYHNAEPLLLNEDYTPEGRYDSVLIPGHLLAQNSIQQQQFYNHMNNHLTGYMQQIIILQSELKQLYQTNHYNHAAYTNATEQFIYHAKRINHYKSLFTEQIIYKSAELIDSKMATFEKLNSSFVQSLDGINSLVESVRKKASTNLRFVQQRVRMLLQRVCDYCNDLTLTRGDLLNVINERYFERGISHLRHYIKDLSSFSEDLDQRLSKLYKEYRNIWKTMIREDVTQLFYAQLHDDVTEMPGFSDERGRHLINLLSSKTLLNVRNSSLSGLTHKELLGYLNADFHDSLLDNLEIEFSDTAHRVHLDSIMGQTGHQLMASYDLTKNSVESIHQAHTIITDDFVRDNIAQVDLLVERSKVTQFTEVLLYGVTELIADVGGSLALLLGASALSVLEILDLLIHRKGIQQPRVEHDCDRQNDSLPSGMDDQVTYKRVHII